MYIFHVCVTITIARQDCHSSSVVHVLYNTVQGQSAPGGHSPSIASFVPLNMLPRGHFDNQIVGVPFLTPSICCEGPQKRNLWISEYNDCPCELSTDESSEESSVRADPRFSGSPAEQSSRETVVSREADAAAVGGHVEESEDGRRIPHSAQRPPDARQEELRHLLQVWQPSLLAGCGGKREGGRVEECRDVVGGVKKGWILKKRKRCVMY